MTAAISEDALIVGLFIAMAGLVLGAVVYGVTEWLRPLVEAWEERRRLRAREAAAVAALERERARGWRLATASFGDHGDDFIAWEREWASS